MKKNQIDEKIQCSKCGEMCYICSQYNLVMCPICKSINNVSTDYNEDHEI
ncbi:hypothetical protein [Clostridium tarantellae]|nr:hypothetical protein [Clostridium tarantellae]